MILQYVTASVIIALAFLMSIFSVRMYQKGVKDGMQIAKGREPTQAKGLIEVLQDKHQEKIDKKEVDKALEGWNNIMNYDGNPQGGDEE